MLILRAIQAALLYGIGAFYALQFVLQTALQFLADPDLAAWLAKKRSVAPALLGDPRYGTHRFVEVNVSTRLGCCLIFFGCDREVVCYRVSSCTTSKRVILGSR